MISHNNQPYWDCARAIYGDQLAHVYVIHAVKQMRVQLTDGRRLLLDRNGNQIGRTLPPVQPEGR
ncbi:hypothetical protein GCM10010988_41590 [Cnuibacter physcomitrellae]|uniref:Uncharacterized protein n=1 Tax=Cnuibacter physcomitrellae TaxID=1619308 RepID=A0A1X9LWR1_9MICO|nr:hypothetical protein [Cnuibacter physcomitrellae]ARJ07729.1 hypothetical protein B5808_20235 [Cnuibacter physcomitrellae]GGI42948.1 hypothetical protein GCM10010988_41590 [Cnuibacter physcomitrellae]